MVFSNERWSQLWRLMFFLLVLMVGLRHKVGGDWGTYLDKINEQRYTPFPQLGNLSNSEPSYILLNWIAAHYGLDVYFVNAVCALFFAWGLIEFCRRQPRPWLAMVVAVPYLLVVVSMGYTRQGVAIGLAMLGMVALVDRKIMRFALFLFLGATFHKSCLLLIPLAALANPQKKLWNIFWTLILLVLVSVLFSDTFIERYKYSYLERTYQSSGASIRVAMNTVPALLFLFFRNRFILPKSDQIFWVWISIMALALQVWLLFSTSTTAIDRIALFVIPLQLFVFSRFPDAFGRLDGNNTALVIVVVLYSALVLFVWLFFASHAAGWLPYQFYPLVWLFE